MDFHLIVHIHVEGDIASVQKVVGKILSDKADSILPIFKYLHSIKKLNEYKCKATSVDHWLNLDQIEEALKV